MYIFSSISVIMASPFMANKSSFKVFSTKVSSLLNLTDSCSRQMSIASMFFLSSLFLITAGNLLRISLMIMKVLSEDPPLTLAYCGYKVSMLSSVSEVIFMR